MNLIASVVVLVVAGLILWAVASAPFIGSRVKSIVRVVIIAAVGLWVVLSVLGLGLPTLPAGG